MYMYNLLMLYLTLERLMYEAFAEGLLQIGPTPFVHNDDTWNVTDYIIFFDYI